MKMDIGEIVSDSIEYPSSDWKKVIIFGLLLLISFLIVPIFLVFGYGFRALKASIAGADELPEFDEWGEMFIDGLKVFVVQFVYFLIPMLIILIVLIGSWASIAAMLTVGDPTAFSGILFGVGFIGVMFAIIIGLIIGLISTIAIAHMAANDSELSAAFQFSEILNIISQIGWSNYIIWYIVIGIISSIFFFVANLLNYIPIIGTIIAVLTISPYGQLFSYRALALLYAYD